LRTNAASNTPGFIDLMFLLLLAGRGVNRADLHTDLAAYAIVQDKGLWPLRDKISDGLCRALCRTETADPAFVDIDLRKIILERRRVKRADLDTYAAGDASDFAILPGIAALSLNDRSPAPALRQAAPRSPLSDRPVRTSGIRCIS